jgi:hypothetical protein
MLYTIKIYDGKKEKETLRKLTWVQVTVLEMVFERTGIKYKIIAEVD